MLLAYDATGSIVATLDYCVARSDRGDVVGLIDFAEHERRGGDHTDIWQVSNAVGSKHWPEWIGGTAHDFTAELSGPPGAKYISALVHKASGHRRERADVERAISETPIVDGVRDVRHLTGGPIHPLRLDHEGRNRQSDEGGGTPAHLPVIGRG